MKIVIVSTQVTEGDYLRFIVQDEDRIIGTDEVIDPETQDIITINVYKQVEVGVVPYSIIEGVFTAKTAIQITNEIVEQASVRFNAYYAQLDIVTSFPVGTILSDT